MTEKELMLAINQIDEEYIMEAEETTAKSVAWHFTLPGTMAACLILGFALLLFGIPLIRKAVSGGNQSAEPDGHTELLQEETKEEQTSQDRTEAGSESAAAYLLDLGTIYILEVASDGVGSARPATESMETMEERTAQEEQAEGAYPDKTGTEEQKDDLVKQDYFSEIGDVSVYFLVIRSAESAADGQAAVSDRYIARFPQDGEEREISGEDLPAEEFVKLVAQEILGVEEIETEGELQFVPAPESLPARTSEQDVSNRTEGGAPKPQENGEETGSYPVSSDRESQKSEEETGNPPAASDLKSQENAGQTASLPTVSGFPIEVCYAENSLEYVTELQAKISDAMRNGELPFVYVSSVRENPCYLEIQVAEDTSEEDIAKVMAFDPTGRAILICYISSGAVFDLYDGAQ